MLPLLFSTLPTRGVTLLQSITIPWEGESVTVTSLDSDAMGGM